MLNIATRAISLALVATVATAAIGVSQAEAGVRYVARPAMGGVRMDRGFRMDRRDLGRADARRSGGRGFDFGGNFGGGNVGTSLAAASLAFGVLGMVADAAANQQAAQPRCGIANQPVLRPNGTYYMRRVQVCQ